MDNSIIFKGNEDNTVKRIKIGKNNTVEDTNFDLICKLSDYLDTGIDRNLLRILVNLCLLGVNPNSLVNILKRLIKFRNTLSNQRS
ncbi:Mitotic-spindle organizing gamma-tubulin ring associated family protein [Theileria parva strain Muguga]|uniref:Mitotic-spindle organizing gamma-tubulin ring associated family protein n=1 Tax=Theileria parva strain Muguga TaxID=333668 RepID=UPI001C618981|nr:Mitotic-spindle organizing gamma-tubulin ring associated family protein [Theileria parva strain Muguga]EAN30489.2 Mitotic-spindle organizing gamma-tubulin ring associated family protein [Theileria parva strain Muguga]